MSGYSWSYEGVRRYLHLDAMAADVIGNPLQLIFGNFLQLLLRSLAVNRVYHHLLRLHLLIGRDKCSNLLGSGVVYRHAVMAATEHHGLYDDMPVKPLKLVYDTPCGVRCLVRTVYKADCVILDRVKLLDIVVDQPESLYHIGLMQHRGIGKHRQLHLREIPVTQRDSIGDYPCEIRMQGRLAVARKRDDIERSTLGVKLFQLRFKRIRYLPARRQAGRAGTLRVVPGLAIEAVESTHLAVIRHKVHTERRTQTAAVNRTEYGRME